jgi:hypothetical protein
VDEALYWLRFLRSSMSSVRRRNTEDDSVAQVLLAVTHTDAVEPTFKPDGLLHFLGQRLGALGEAASGPLRLVRSEPCVPRYDDAVKAGEARSVLIRAIEAQVSLCLLRCCAPSLLVRPPMVFPMPSLRARQSFLLPQVAGQSTFEVDVFALNVAQAIATDLKAAKKAPVMPRVQLIEMMAPRLRAKCEAKIADCDRLRPILDDLEAPGRVVRIIEDLAATGDLIVVRGTVILDAVRWCSQLLAAFINDSSDAETSFDAAWKSDLQILEACVRVGIHIDVTDVTTIKHLLVETLEVCFEDATGRVCFPCLLPSPPANDPTPLPVHRIGCGCRFLVSPDKLELMPPSVFNTVAVRARSWHPLAEVSCSHVVVKLRAAGMVVRLEQRGTLYKYIELTVVADVDQMLTIEVLHDEAWRWIELVRDVLREKARGLAASERFPCYECIAAGRAEPSEHDVSAEQDGAAPIQCMQCTKTLDRQRLCCLPRTPTQQPEVPVRTRPAPRRPITRRSWASPDRRRRCATSGPSPTSSRSSAAAGRRSSRTTKRPPEAL